jgi:hypothetical protein
MILAGCSAHRTPLSASAGSAGASGAALRSGDLVVAVNKGKARHAILRVQWGLRPKAALDQLFVTEHFVSGLAASSDGRWLALQTDEGEGERRVRLWDLRHGPGEVDPAEVWASPLGCLGPEFEAQSREMVVACPPKARQPASVLKVELPTLEALQLVGESDRRAPTFGVEGDIYWAEQRERHNVVVRRSSSEVPFVTHDLTEAIAGMWPQLNGSLVVELDRRGSARSFARLSASGVGKVEVPPPAWDGGIRTTDVLHVGERGLWWVANCDHGACALRSGLGSQLGQVIPLGGTPSALAEVSWPHPRVAHPEDLATAPASVLSSHPSTQVSVLGVSLGMALEDAFAVLDQMGRHPYWIENRGARNRPRGIGVGWTAEGHCIEYLADERASVTTIDLSSCAASYVSPALRPLLDRGALATQGVVLARRFLGDSVTSEVTRTDTPVRHPEVRRTDMNFSAPERGYQYEARSEVLRSRRTRVIGGWVRLRLQLPGRRQASTAPR